MSEHSIQNRYPYRQIKLEGEKACGYFETRPASFESFTTSHMEAEELEFFLSQGWRKFGPYFFKPKCRNCNACIPLRVLTHQFQTNKNQRRIIKKNLDTIVRFQPLEYREEIFEVFKEHSLTRFNQLNSLEDFFFSFYDCPCPALQSEYFIDNKLVAVGFLDISSKGISSVYFSYRKGYSEYQLGHFSAISEIQYAKSLSLPYYYLGYTIREKASMAYKQSYKPYEIFDWSSRAWTADSAQPFSKSSPKPEG